MKLMGVTGQAKRSKVQSKEVNYGKQQKEEALNSPSWLQEEHVHFSGPKGP